MFEGELDLWLAVRKLLRSELRTERCKTASDGYFCCHVCQARQKTLFCSYKALLNKKKLLKLVQTAAEVESPKTMGTNSGASVGTLETTVENLPAEDVSGTPPKDATPIFSGPGDTKLEQLVPVPPSDNWAMGTQLHISASTVTIDLFAITCAKPGETEVCSEFVSCTLDRFFDDAVVCRHSNVNNFSSSTA